MSSKKAEPQDQAQTKPTFNFKKVKAVTLPVRKSEVDVPVFFKFTEAVKKGEAIEAKPDGTPKDPVDIFVGIDLETGEECQIIAGMILCETIKREYKDDTYIGKCFQFIKQPIKGSGANKYHPWSIVEIEV